MKAAIELECDQLESIVRHELTRMLSYLENDLDRVKEKDTGYVFSSDKQKDIKKIKKHIKSFKRVLKYYGGDL